MVGSTIGVHCSPCSRGAPGLFGSMTAGIFHVSMVSGSGSLLLLTSGVIILGHLCDTKGHCWLLLWLSLCHAPSHQTTGNGGSPGSLYPRRSYPLLFHLSSLVSCRNCGLF